MKFAKLASTLCQIVNEPVQNGQSFITQHQSGEISANLVTLKGPYILQRSIVLLFLPRKKVDLQVHGKVS